jgi:hypothetical protein
MYAVKAVVQYNNQAVYSTYPGVNPDVSGLKDGSAKQWGPAPFAVALYDVFTPNSPDGSNSKYLTAGYYSLQIGSEMMKPKITLLEGAAKPYSEYQPGIWQIPITKSW